MVISVYVQCICVKLMGREGIREQGEVREGDRGKEGEGGRGRGEGGW